VPKGVQTCEEGLKARQVREMFGAISARYDLLNHLLSGGIDRRWRRTCAFEVGNRLDGTHPRILDIGCGTGDLSMAFQRQSRVVGCDFCHPMLEIGRRKISDAGRSGQVVFLAADALMLPFPDSSFDAVVSAFVLRNLANRERGLSEMRRVLRPGGVLGVVDFSMPTAPVMGALYRFYFLRILPRLGKLISGVDGPYRYLPESVSNFPGPAELCSQIERVGFRAVEHRLMTGGIAMLLLGIAE
jgi:demethylmenaquinone methyltransferase/2-methoxy-6-polyprenyl-1,4-benzoquinol methylase